MWRHPLVSWSDSPPAVELSTNNAKVFKCPNKENIGETFAKFRLQLYPCATPSVPSSRPWPLRSGRWRVPPRPGNQSEASTHDIDQSEVSIQDIDQSEASITWPGTAQVRMTILLALLLRLFRNLASSSAGMCSPTSSSVQQFWRRRKLNDIHHNIWRRPSIAFSLFVESLLLLSRL